jgi:hypothetical protein
MKLTTANKLLNKGLFCASAILATIGAGSALAGQVPSIWLGGRWNCNIDGRSARMEWRVVEDSDCGPGCHSSAVRWDGRFSDNGAAWVPLTNLQAVRSGGFFFRHADGNRWYLAAPVNNRTVGYTTWNGNRYRLSCSR